jgi:MarR family transcriptional regulator for hemolysin
VGARGSAPPSSLASGGGAGAGRRRRGWCAPIVEWLVEQQLLKQENSRAPLGLVIAAAHRSIKQAATPRLRRWRLSPQQFWLLVAIHEQPGPLLRELAARRLMDSPTASRMVDLLVRRGLVRIQADPEDRRRRSILLSERGAALVRSLDPLAGQIREAVRDGFGEAEAESLRGLLLRVIANMERFEGRVSAAAARRATERRSA